MGGSFATSDDEANVDARPLRAPQRREEVWTEARNLASELPRWRVLEADEARGVLVCECAAGLLAPPSRATLTFASPQGIPSTPANAPPARSGGAPGPP